MYRFLNKQTNESVFFLNKYVLYKTHINLYVFIYIYTQNNRANYIVQITWERIFLYVNLKVALYLDSYTT